MRNQEKVKGIVNIISNPLSPYLPLPEDISKNNTNVGLEGYSASIKLFSSRDAGNSLNTPPRAVTVDRSTEHRLSGTSLLP